MDARQRSSLVAFLLLFVLIASLFFWMVSSFLVALFMGQLLAFLLAPVYRRLVGRGWRPHWAAVSATALLVFGLLLPVAAFSTLAIREGIVLAEELEGDARVDLASLVRRAGPARRLLGPPETAERRARDTLRAGAKTASLALLRLLKGLPRIALSLALALVAAFFLLMDEAGGVRLALAPLPLDRDLVVEAIETFRATAAATVWAALAAACVQTVMLGAAMLIVGLPGVFAACGVAFVSAWVPLVSSAPIWLAAAGYLAWQGQPWQLTVLLVIGTLTYVVDHLVRPYVLRGRARMHPLLGLISTLGGIHAFGLAGVFVGPVIAALLVSLYRIWPRTAQRYGIEVTPSRG